MTLLGHMTHTYMTLTHDALTVKSYAHTYVTLTLTHSGITLIGHTSMTYSEITVES